MYTTESFRAIKIQILWVVLLSLCFILIRTEAFNLSGYARGALSRSKPSQFMPVVCYYYGWSSTRPKPMNYEPEDIPGHLCTDVILAHVGVDNRTGELESVIPQYIRDPSRYRRFTDIKSKYPLMRTLISVGGWQENGAEFSDLVNSAKKRKAFVSSALQWLERYSLDGLDILWQYPAHADRGGKPSDKKQFVVLLQELKSEFEKRNYLLTAAFPVDQSLLDKGFDVPELVKNLDWVNVLTFDLRGKWTGSADVPTPLNRRSFDKDYYQALNVKDGLQRLVDRGTPKEKLIVGMCFYGRTFKLANRKEHGIQAAIDKKSNAKPGPFVTSSEILGYYEICNNVKRGQWTRVFHEESKCPYAYFQDQWVGYDDEESIAHKMDLILDQQYGGVMVWNNDLDDFKGVCGKENPLLSVINEKLIDLELDPRKKG